MIHPHIGQLLNAVQAERAAIVHHPVLAQVQASGAWPSFMQLQAFAVWDARYLAHHICGQLAPDQASWKPKVSPESVFLMNRVGAGAQTRYQHYLKLMEQVGAHAGPVLQLDFYKQQGLPLPEAMTKLNLSQAIQQFVLYTFYAIGQLPLHAQVAMLLLGREDLLTDALEPLLGRPGLSEGSKQALMDTLAMPWRALGQTPAQAAVRLLPDLCGEDSVRWTEATQAVRQSLVRRARMMDALQENLVANGAAMSSR